MRVVVIGNGISGFSAASTLRRLDDRCEVILIASEAHPLYSACVLPDYISGQISRKQVFVRSRSDYENLSIRALWGREAKEIDPDTKKISLDDGRNIDFDRLILATGSEALIFGDRKKGLFKLKTLKDADEIKKHRGEKAVVIGAGPIGVEIGIALLKRGYRVTIVEMMDKVLPLGLDRKGAEKVKSMLEERGMEILLSERSEKVLGSDRVEGLVTSKCQIDCDMLLWAVGMRPRVDLAKQAGIVLGEKGGIRVNPTWRQI
jgi:NADH oxidase (H2O2-forming)